MKFPVELVTNAAPNLVLFEQLVPSFQQRKRLQPTFVHVREQLNKLKTNKGVREEILPVGCYLFNRSLEWHSDLHKHLLQFLLGFGLESGRGLVGQQTANEYGILVVLS